MKRSRIIGFGLAILLALAMITGDANAIVYTFSDKDYYGGASWGTMTITAFDSDTLQVMFEFNPSNSALTSANPGAQVTGFGFTFLPETTVPNTITNPANNLFPNDQNNLVWNKLTNLNAIPNPANGDEFTPVIKKSDYFYGATEGNSNNINPPGIQIGQMDIFYLNFQSPLPQNLESFIDLTGIRLQSINCSVNGGSLFLGGNDPPAPVPEPGTMMLLGSGLAGLAGWGRKKFRK